MGLSNELIESFVKIANDDSNKKKKDTTVMGTVVKYNNKDYVKLDGSELLTPVDSTIVSQNGDRVMVLIKDHTATITGSTSSPSASNKDLNDTKTEIGSKISEFEIVIADKVSTKEFDAEKGRIDDLLAENVRIKEKLTATEANIGELTADNVTINEQLTAANANIENLSTKKLDAEVADLTYATIDNLNATNASVNNLTSNYGEFKELATNKFTANEAAINNLETNKLSAEDADIRYATIRSLNATDAKVNTLEGNFGSFKALATDKLSANEAAINDLEAKKLSATDADIKYANIDFTNIDIAAISTLFTESGIIKNLVVSGGNITGELVGVTIKGDLIEAGTVKADKLVVKGSDGLFYKLNIEGGATTSTEVTEEDLKNGLSGRLIVAKSITAEKIAVDDLVAFGATIGGFHITSNSLYSGAKTSATNTTRGVFFGNDGQFAVGDSNNYVKFFKGTDGNYKLYIAAEDLIFGSSGKSVEAALNDTKTEINNNVNTQLNDAKVEINNSVNTQINNAKTEINTSINNTKSELNTNINNTKNELAGKIEGIEIGGRNLIVSKNVVTGWVNSTGAIVSDDTYRASGYISVSPGDTITFQLWTPNSVRSWIDDTYFDLNKQYVTGYNGEYVTGDHIVKTYTVPEGVSYVRMSYSWANGYKAKLERGNKPTDYTPAPEDVDPDNVQVGGRNLIIRSMSREKAYYAGSSYTSTESLSDSGLINSWAMESYISVSPGEELTFSRKAGLGSYFYVSWYTKDKSYLGNAQISGIGNKSSGHYTWKVPDNANYIRVSYPGDLGSESKLERGNRATDWSQAPEDIDTTISSTLESIMNVMTEQNTSLIKNSEAIMLEALKSYAEVGDFEALKKSMESQLKLLSDRMTLNFSQTTERLEYTNNELQSQISTITKYFKFNIDGLTIGSNESPYSVIIDNDRYSMKYFSKEIFYVANGKLYTPDLEVSGIFNLKDYLIDYDGSDNLNITYIGKKNYT